MLASLKRPYLIAILTVLLCAVFVYAWAGTTTAATGGAAISADTAATGGTGAWTTLTGPSYGESVNGDIATGGYVTLTAPSGFEFNAAATVNVVLTLGDRNNAANMNEAPVGGTVARTSNGSLVVTPTMIYFYVSSKSRGNTLNTIQWQGIQVRPTQGTPLATGNIIIGLPGGSVMPSSTNAGTLVEVPGALTRLLTVLPGQSFVSGTGTSGTGTAQTAGTAFSLSRLIATDKFNNVITSYSGARTISYTGPAVGCTAAPSYTTSVNFTNGLSTSALSTTLVKAETTTITASDGTVTGPASSAFVVGAAPATQLFVTLPGQTFVPCAGNSGTPADQGAGIPFDITTITATDRFLNIATSYEGSKPISYSGPTGTNTYTSPVNFTAAQSTTALQTTIGAAQTTTITASDGAIGGPASSSFVVRSTVGNFNGFEPSTAAGAISGVIKTKIAGTAFSLDLVALNSTGTAPMAFTGTVKLELVDATSGLCAAMPSIQTLPNQTFLASENGRHPVSGIVQPNAWKNVRLRISQPATSPTSISCSNDNFSIRPARFGLTAASDADDQTAGTTRTLANLTVPGGVVHKAGQPFTISATAQNASGVTTANYLGAPNAILSQCSTAAVCPPAAALGALTITSWTNTAGLLSTSNATYSEVGAFSLVLQDQTFANVDTGDSTTAERYVTSAAFAVGRFVPDHFSMVPSALVPRTDLAACSASTFTYMDEPFSASFTLIAQNAGPTNGTTKNYRGSLATLNPGNASHLNFGAVDGTGPRPLVAPVTAISRANPGRVTTGTKHGLVTGGAVFLSGLTGMSEANNLAFDVIVVDEFNFTINANTSAYSPYVAGGNASRLAFAASTGAWSDGMVSIVSTLALQRSIQPDGPFNTVTIGAAPRDADGVVTTFSNLDADANGVNDRQSLGSMRFLFGRMLLDNAYGSELLNLRVALRTQYWDGTVFRLSGDDNCTAITSAANVTLANYRGGVSASNLASPGNVQLGAAVSAGAGGITLKKPFPLATVRGSADMTINLDAEGKKYLKGRGTGTRYDQNPSSRATFGVYKGGPVIYVRETY